MPAACNCSHDSAMGKRYQRHPICSVQAAADYDGLRAAGQGMGRMVPAVGVSLVAGQSTLRPCRAGLPGERLCQGAVLVGGIRPACSCACRCCPAGKTQTGEARPLPGQGIAASTQHRMHPSGCACAAAGYLIAAIGYDGQQVAGGMGAAAPHVDAMVACRPSITRKAISALFLGRQRALQTSGCSETPVRRVAVAEQRTGVLRVVGRSTCRGIGKFREQVTLGINDKNVA